MGHSVLLIDDSAILRRIATNVLGGPSARFDVVTATRATEGFARACATPPSVILVDAHLAGAPKEDLCQRLLTEPRTAAIPVVLLMGRGMAGGSSGEHAENVVETLSKPFTPEQLLACVTAIHKAAKDGAGFQAIRQRVRGKDKEAALLVDRQAATAAAAERSKEPVTGATSEGSSSASSSDKTPAGPTKPLEPHSLRSSFQRIANEKGTGVLVITAGNQPLMEVYFDAGRVVTVTTEDVGAYTTGALGVLPPKVSPATLEAAAEEQQKSGVPFILTLGARGLLSKAAAVDLLHQFGQRFFARVWQLRSGTIRSEFTSLDALPGFTLRLEPSAESTDSWLLGTLRCVGSEDIASKGKHEGFVGTPSFLRKGQAALASLELTDREREFSKRVDGRLDLPGIAKAMGCTAESAYLILHRFRALEIMDYRPAPRAFMVTPRTSVRRVLPLPR